MFLEPNRTPIRRHCSKWLMCCFYVLLGFRESSFAATPANCALLGDSFEASRKRIKLADKVADCPYGMRQFNPYNLDLAFGPRNSCHEMAAGAVQWLLKAGAPRAWMLETSLPFASGRGNGFDSMGHTIVLSLTRYQRANGQWMAQIFDPQTRYLTAEFPIGRSGHKVNMKAIPERIRLEVRDLFARRYGGRENGKLKFTQLAAPEEFRWQMVWSTDPINIGIGPAPLVNMPSVLKLVEDASSFEETSSETSLPTQIDLRMDATEDDPAFMDQSKLP